MHMRTCLLLKIMRGDDHYPLLAFGHNVRPVLILFGQMREMVGKCPTSDCYFKLCDYQTGAVAWCVHVLLHVHYFEQVHSQNQMWGVGHNWDGTSASVEGDMLNEILQDVCKEEFVLSELVVDKSQRFKHQCYPLSPFPTGHNHVLS